MMATQRTFHRTGKSSNATEHAVQVFALLASVAAADEYQLPASIPLPSSFSSWA
jgi:hypothetical protein